MPRKNRPIYCAVGSRTSVDIPLVLKVHRATVPPEGKLSLTSGFSMRPKELGFRDATPGSDTWFACANLLSDSMWAHRQNMFWTPLNPLYIQPVVSADGELDFDFTLFDAWVR